MARKFAVLTVILVALVAGTGLAVHGLVQATRSQARAEAEAATTRAINDFLGGGLDVEKMAMQVDPDLYRNRAD